MNDVSWPFLGSEALADRALAERAMRRWYQPIYPDVYLPRGAELTASHRARAAWLWSGRQAVVAGQSAAVLLGAKWGDPLAAAELAWGNRRPPPMIVAHSDTLLPGEVCDVDGIAVTTTARTAFDIARRAQRTEALSRLDALARATVLIIAEVDAIGTVHKGARGIRRARRVLPLVDGGSESPQESRTRLVLIDGGLPRPETQIRVCNRWGDFVGRIDMGWREWLVGVEYDGAQHWTDPRRRAADIDRQVALEELGWIIVRVSSDLLYYRPATIVARAQEALHRRGWAASVNLATPERRVA